MAVSIMTDTIRAAASVGVFSGGEDLLAAGAVRGVEPGYGGVNADVADGKQSWQVWVGVVGGVLTGECDCRDALAAALCPHTVAAALAGVRVGLTWTSLPESHASTQALDPAERRFRALAQSVTPAELVALIARHAVRNRLLATDLEVVTGRLGAPSTEDLAPLRALVDEARSIPDGRYEYDLHDIVTAVRAVLAELRAQALRPPSGELLDAVEYVVERWDHLAGVLSQDWRTYDNESGEIGAELAALHLDLCEQLRNDPLELAERLATLVAACEVDCCLNPPAPYRHLLGPDGVAAFEERWKVLRRW
ncbi:hypothetical protein [Kitasatospora azatica]|uniref:hypothetical protein n=1 Tax=Kitasatospora azatica TaxID=58347 RepID=UPI0012FA6213|nr:hypothetical protein [Kitasatospora azatica]